MPGRPTPSRLVICTTKTPRCAPEPTGAATRLVRRTGLRLIFGQVTVVLICSVSGLRALLVHCTAPGGACISHCARETTVNVLPPDGTGFVDGAAIRPTRVSN